ncbi:hypothetical protein J4Q44_G00390280 [Coregonus suidteri]|uniref:Pyrin domain-containing protein n=1 Tax=Coregonus suidteri TaxID=861788 RepID=A0AAN8KQ75_9TELE
MLAVPALLLTTLEEMNPHELKTFQSFLTSGLLPDCPPIPESQLENADRQVTVDQMVKTYGPERAVEITLRILRGMKRVDLAEKLETDHRGGTASTSHLSLFPPGPDPSSPLCGYPPFPPFSPALSSSQCGYPPVLPPSFLSHLGSGSSLGQLISQRPSMLAVPALLLTTLEEMNPHELKTFQFFMTSGLLPDCPPIPESQLENADRQVTVDQMVKTYGPERALNITLRILRGMKRVELAEKLETDHRGATLRIRRPTPNIHHLHSHYFTGSSKKLLALTSAGSSGQLSSQETPKLEMDCPPILERPLEMANSVNTEVAVNTQENTQRMDEELGRERGSPLFLEHHHMSSPDEFTPEIHDQDNRREYQFQCPSAGLFQCSITGLVFRMEGEGEGEVLYRTVPWDRRLLAQRGKRLQDPCSSLHALRGLSVNYTSHTVRFILRVDVTSCL